MRRVSREQIERRRLEMQGYEGFSDRELAAFGVWSRFAPAVCTVSVTLGTVLGSAPFIWTLGLTAVLGAALPYHPFDILYNRVLRPLLGTPPLPRQGLPRRFACFVATFWLAGTGWAFMEGAILTGTILGGAFVVVAAIPAMTGFCVPSWLWRLAEGGLRRRKYATVAVMEQKGSNR